MTNKEFFLQIWQDEAKTTANALRALPSTGLDYKPDSKSRSAQAIAEHIIPHTDDVVQILDTGVCNHISFAKIEDMHKAADAMEKGVSAIESALNKVDDKTWNEKVVPFFVNGNKIYEQPMYSMCWGILFDIIHHRGQLSTYYRPMGVRNPAIYGPTAEMMEEMMDGEQS